MLKRLVLMLVIAISCLQFSLAYAAKEYNEEVTKVKKEWLAKHLPSVTFDRITIVKYGTPKSTCGNGILFDDEIGNRNEWKGIAYDAENILEVLRTL